MKVSRAFYNIVTVFLCALLVSCSNLSEKEIEETVSSGVVLIQNQSYYEAVLSNGESLFFSGFDSDGNLVGLALVEDSVQASTSYGTGFFVSEKGQIVTNAHVVTNMTAEKEINKSVSNILRGLKKLLEYSYAQTYQEYQEAQEAVRYAYYSDDVSASDYFKVKAYCDALKDKLEECRDTYNEIGEVRASDTEIRYHSEISIAYNDTYVTSTKDFVSCVVTKTDTDHDLAIVQLKDKRTPERKYIFQVPEADPLEEYSFLDKVKTKFSEDKNSKLFMTSFNLGPTLALTKEGVKSQFNSGSISQRTDDRLMYSIPALHGSSGSPVVNLQAELVAINYAGLDATQSFNYGIRVKHLRNLLNK